MILLYAIAPEIRDAEFFLCAGVPLLGRLAPPPHGLRAVISDAETSGAHISQQGLSPGISPLRQGLQKAPSRRRVQSVVCRYAVLQVAGHRNLKAKYSPRIDPVWSGFKPSRHPCEPSSRPA